MSVVYELHKLHTEKQLKIQLKMLNINIVNKHEVDDNLVMLLYLLNHIKKLMQMIMELRKSINLLIKLLVELSQKNIFHELKND